MSFIRDKSIEIILRYQSPNGAYVACPNFEQYRFCWLRDGSFIAYSMDVCGQHDSARRFFTWVNLTLCTQTERLRNLIDLAAAGRVPDTREMLPTRYRLDGSTEDAETWPNFQLDGYGTWLWALAEHIRRTGETTLLKEFAQSIRMTMDYLINFWNLPNYDCWEEFGDKIHTSTLSCIYGGLQAINQYLDDPKIEKVLTSISHFISENCVADQRLVKYSGSLNIDASLLWAGVPFEVFRPDAPLITKTVLEIEKVILHEGGVHRYPEDTYYGGGEWLLLSSWLGWYYCKTGKLEAAQNIVNWVEAQADTEGEMPEQTSRHVNDPSYIQPWIDRWGPIAKPLLWSHAMYLVLVYEIDELKKTTFEPTIRNIRRG